MTERVGGDTGAAGVRAPGGRGSPPRRVTLAGAFLGVGEGVRPRGGGAPGGSTRACAWGSRPWGSAGTLLGEIDEGSRLQVGTGGPAEFAPAEGHARGGAPWGSARTHIREGAPWGSARPRAHDALLESATVRNSIIRIDMLPIGLIG